MAKGNITASPKWGVNPCLGRCFYCSKETEVVLLGHLTRRKAVHMFGTEITDSLRGEDNDLEAPSGGVVLGLEPCEDCEVFYPNAEEGVFFIQVDDGGHPTGQMMCVRDSAVKAVSYTHLTLPTICSV